MTTSTSRPAPFSGGNSLTVTSGPEQPPLSATSGSYDNRRRVAPDICSCRFLSRPPAYRFRRTAASRQKRPVRQGRDPKSFRYTRDTCFVTSGSIGRPNLGSFVEYRFRQCCFERRGSVSRLLALGGSSMTCLSLVPER